MPRKQVNDLQDVNLGGAARQVNTFVFGPRAARTNSALALSDALSGVGKKLEAKRQQEIKLDVKQATENKLYGGTLFTNTVDEATAGYETRKDEFDTVEAASEFFIQSTTPEGGFKDVHQEAGFREAQAKALGKFRGAHAQYLAKKKQDATTRDVLNDFFLTTKTEGSDEAFTRLRTISDNTGIPKEEVDKIPLGAAKILISQGRYEEAESILTNKRGGAGTLTERSNTAIEANDLLEKVQQGKEDRISAAAKDLRDQRRLNELDQAKKENEFLTTVISDDSKTHEQKVLEINKAELTGQVSDEFATEYRRVLKSQNDLVEDSDPTILSDTIQRVYDVNALADTDPESYLTGINNINKDLMGQLADGLISKKDFDKVQKQIQNLTNAKTSEATQLLPRVYKTARSNIEQQLPPEFRAEALRELYDETEAQREALGEDPDRKTLENLYKSTSNKIIQKVQDRRREKAQQALQPKDFTEDDKVFLESTGITAEEVEATARNRNMTKQQVLEVLRQKVPVEDPADKLLEKISGAESGGNYNVIFGGKEEPLTTMTVDEVLKLQADMHKDGGESTAVGKYQLINKTLKELINKHDIPKDRLFDEKLQDDLGRKLLERRGLKEWKEGSLDNEKFIENLSKEWAALPKDASGKSYYSGVGSNKSKVAYNDIKSLLEKL